MLHAWNLVMLASCLALASLSLARGLAGLLAGRGALSLLEALVFVLAGAGGMIGTVLAYQSPTY